MDVANKKAQLKSQFRSMDKNGDNMLDFNEFLTLMPGLDSRTAHKLFEKVDKTGDGTIDFDEFVDYIYSKGNSRTTASRHMRLAAASAVSSDTEDEALWETCMAVFETYEGSDKKFEGKDFKKLCLDCKLFDRKFTRNDVDIVFTKYKPRGKNTIDFEAFKNCVRSIAQKKGTATQAIQAAVAERISVGVESSATKADFVRFHDDKNTYTGMHTSNEFHGDTADRSERTTDARHARIKNSEALTHSDNDELPWDQVEEFFIAFCQGDSFMDGKDFIRLCVDCDLFIKKQYEKVDADIIFNKVKNRGERKIDFSQFQDACVAIARKRDCSVAEVQRALIETRGPSLHGVTQADNVRFHDDKSLYTGMHAAQFDM
eukprot:CAMPEP_0204576484 /NCGR_PEP_ID=MMETSP0661-20131031/41801_1 /ASSEMBLY_ACC=CAM_ASM_000606 /TAXON_ID=109239 /ORGANISM="Alexandrium margalefi, Strain AMGDE01CS-322" /LENGTH=372 /DNA_ID=CAMNT_0051585239 /DNA_START=88 /DNA_END=1206 /DNA_ORIENTATION=-